MAAVVPVPWQKNLWRKTFLRYLKAQQVSDIAVSKILADAAKDAEREINRSLSDDRIGATVRRAQYRQSKAALQRINAEMWDDVSVATVRGMAESSAIAAEALSEMTDRLAGSIRPKRRLAMLADSIQAAADNSIDNVRSRLLNNIDLAPSVYKNSALTAKTIDKVVNNGIALNKSAAEIAKDARKYIRPDVQGGVDYAAKRLARTEINNALHTTSIQGSAELPFVEGVQWNLSGSHPKPDACNDYAEKDHDDLGAGIFKKGNVPGKPHPNCLCYTTTITESDEDFLQNLIGGQYNSFLKANGRNPI